MPPSVGWKDFEALAGSLTPPVGPFDLMLVGDGSGNFATTPCGWACFLYRKCGLAVSGHFGATTGGTNNYAELAPYVYVLGVVEAENRLVHPLPRRPRVLVVSDSEVTVRCGSGAYARNANLNLWAEVDRLAKTFDIEWRHVRRNSNPISALADECAGRVRAAVEGLKLPVGA